MSGSGSLDGIINSLGDKIKTNENLPESIKSAINNDVLTQNASTFSKSFIKSKYAKNLYSDEIEGYLGDLETQGLIRVNGDKVYVEGYEAQTSDGHYCDDCGKYFADEEELSSHNMEHIPVMTPRSDYEEAENREDLHLNQADQELGQAIQAHQDETVTDVGNKLDDVQDRATPQLDPTISATEKTKDYLSGHPDEVENPEVLDNQYHDDPNYLLGDRKVHVTTEYSLDRILDVLEQEDNGAFGSEADGKDPSPNFQQPPKNEYVKTPGLESACDCLDTVAGKLGGVEMTPDYLGDDPKEEVEIEEPEEQYKAGEFIIKPKKSISMGFTCESCGMFYDRIDAAEFYAHKAIAHEQEEQATTMQPIQPDDIPQMPVMEAGPPEDIWNNAESKDKEEWSHEYLNRNPAFANELIDRDGWAFETARTTWNNQSPYITEQLPDIMRINKEEEEEEPDTSLESYNKFVQQGKKEWASERWAEQAKVFERATELKKKLGVTEDFNEQDHPRDSDGKLG